MAFETNVTVYADYLKIRVEGTQTVDSVLALLELIRNEAERAQRRHVLVDYLAVETRDLTANDRIMLGAQLAAIAGHRLKIAVVYDAPRIDQTTIRQATQRGAAVTTVSSEEEGISWLGSWQPR